MAVKTSYRTVIVCDGKEGFCPEGAVLDIGQPPSAALRRAAKSGWLVGGEVLCPTCQGSGRPEPMPEWQTRRTASIHRLPSRSVAGQFPDSPECPYVCHQLTA